MVAARPTALQLQIYVLSNLLISHRGNFSRTRGQQISLCWAVALGKHHWLAFQSELGDKSDSSQLSAVRTAAGVIITVHVSEGGRVPVSSVSTLCVHSNAHQLGHSPTQGQQSKLTLWKNRRLQIFHILLIADFIDRQHLRVRRVCY